MSRMRVWGGIFTIAMLLSGGQGLSAAVAQSQSSTYSTSDYIQNRPNASWINLENATLDLGKAAYSQAGWFGIGNQLREIYIPVFAGSDQDRKQIQMVITSSDPALLETIRGMRAAGNEGESARQRYMIDNADKILLTRNVSGFVKKADRLDERTHEKLQNLYGDQLAKNFVFVPTNNHPHPLLSAGLGIGGLALGAWVVRPLLQRNREA